MTPASLLPLACATLLSTCQLLLSPDVEDEECGANDWLQLSSGHWMPKLGLGTAGLTDPDVVSRVVSDALTAGYRMIDTADLYENHRQIATALNISLPSLGLGRKVNDSVFF